MKNLICSNIFGDFGPVNDLTWPVNSQYAIENNCDFILDDKKRCTDATSFWWEKIAFIREIVPTRDENDLVVWADVDSLIQKTAVISEILSPTQDWGMVPIYAGHNAMEKQNWYNAGIIAIRNTSAVRDFIEMVWERRSIDKDDETAIVKELPMSNIRFKSLDPKWNCWKNNAHLVKDPSIVTFHGIYPVQAKVDAISKFLL